MATFRKRGPYQWQAQVRKKGLPLQTKTFETRAKAEQWPRAIEVEMDKGVLVSRAEAESTALKELMGRYLAEVTPLKKGAAPETNCLRALMRLPLAWRYIAGIHGVDIARKEWGIHVHNPVRDIKLPSDNRPRDRRMQAGEENTPDGFLPVGTQSLATAHRATSAGDRHAPVGVDPPAHAATIYAFQGRGSGKEAWPG